MKTLIATSIIALAIGSAGAAEGYDFNSEEFYLGQGTSHNIVINPAVAAHQDWFFDEGRFPQAIPGADLPRDQGMAELDFPENLYLDGQWPI